jgi:hypothetical protein
MYRNLNSLAEGTGSQVLGLHTRVNCFITQFQDQVDIASLSSVKDNVVNTHLRVHRSRATLLTDAIVY